MPAHMKWKLNSRKKVKAFNSKPKKTAKLIPWDDSVTDLSIYSSTPEEIKRRHLTHTSKNLEIAKMELFKKAVKQHKDMYSREENKENDCVKQYNGKKCTAVPVITLAPRAEEKERVISNVINENFKNINYCSSSGSITEGPISKQDKTNICRLADSKENASSASTSTTEIEQMLLCFQNNLHVREENQDTPTLFTKSRGNVSGITSLILTTLERLNQKCTKACDDLVLEKKKTKALKKEVADLRKEVNALKQDLISLQMAATEMNSRSVTHIPQLDLEDSSFQSQLELLKTPNKDQLSFISSTIEQNLSNRAQCSSCLQSPSIQTSTDELSGSTSNNSESRNSSYCSNAHESEIHHSPTPWQSLGTAVMLSSPVQLNLMHRHCKA